MCPLVSPQVLFDKCWPGSWLQESVVDLCVINTYFLCHFKTCWFLIYSMFEQAKAGHHILVLDVLIAQINRSYISTICSIWLSPYNNIRIVFLFNAMTAWLFTWLSSCPTIKSVSNWETWLGTGLPTGLRFIAFQLENSVELSAFGGPLVHPMDSSGRNQGLKLPIHGRCR